MKYRELIEKTLKPTEIKDIIDTKGNLEDYWSNNLLYDSNNVYDIYMKSMNQIESDLDIGKTWQEEYSEFDDDTGEDETYSENITLEGQESYLGYIPKEDMFVSGWDCWYNGDYDTNESTSGLVFFKIVKGKYKFDHEEMKDGDTMYGSKQGGYKTLHRRYKDLCDIRLD